MIGTRGYLRDMSNIVPCSFKLPNHEAIVTLKEGTIHLGGGLKLKHIRFVSNLK